MLPHDEIEEGWPKGITKPNGKVKCNPIEILGLRRLKEDVSYGVHSHYVKLILN